MFSKKLMRNKELTGKGVAGVAVLMISVCSAGASADLSASSVHPETWPAGHVATLNPSIESFIADVLAHMTLEEKVGQMIQADIASITPEELRRYRLGSVLAGGNSAPSGNTRTTPQAWLNLTDDLYRASLSAQANGHPPIPIVFGIDAVHGNAKLIGSTIFPHNVGLGAMRDAELVREIGAATAQEVAVVGIDWTFAPTVAVARDVRWGRSYESYSEEPKLVAQYAAAVVEGLQGRREGAEFLSSGHTLASVKHFIGDGGTRDGRDQGDTQIDESELRTIHGAGYLPAINAGAMIVMASYNSWNGVKTHANRGLLTEVLKGRMGFQGFVVGDWNAQEQIPGCTKFDCPAAFLAGIDMLMAPDSWKMLYENTLAEAKSQVIPSARIDDAVRRILRVKASAGFFMRASPKQRVRAGDFSLLGAAEHRALARRAVRESLVLLKNEQGLLPLNPRARLLVSGALADDIGAQAGGWTVDWQGDHNRNQDFPGATSIFAGIRAAASAAGGSAILSADGSFRERPDAAVVIFGERPYAEFQGDRETLQFTPQDPQALALLKRLHRSGIPTVAVFLSGRPLWVNPEINAADAFVAAWLPGSEGEGVADMLFGEADHKPVDFTGRLGFSWPNTAMPVSFSADGGVRNALYSVGYGLGYHDRGRAARLSEKPQVDVRYRAEPGSLYHAAHPTAPWSLFLADGGDQVHVTTSQLSSPHAAIGIENLAEGSRIAWSGITEGLVEISGRAVNLSDEVHTPDLQFTYRVEVPPDQPVYLSIGCTQSHCGTARDVQLDLTAQLRQAAPEKWQTMKVAMSCFSALDADLRAVEMPFILGTAGHLKLVLAEVRLQPGTGIAVPCPVAGYALP